MEQLPKLPDNVVVLRIALVEERHDVRLKLLSRRLRLFQFMLP